MMPAADVTTNSAWLHGVAARAQSLIRGLQDASGAYPASPNFSAYQGYCWFRDGAFIADAMSAAGQVRSAQAFHEWCAKALAGWRERVDLIMQSPAALADARLALPARLRLDGTEADDDWANHQVDGLGTWLWALGEHAKRHEIDVAPLRPAIEVAVDYLVVAGTLPCFDWWEERPAAVHPSTLACVAAGLRSAADMGVLDRQRASMARAHLHALQIRLHSVGGELGYLPKTEGSRAVDAAAIAAVAPLRVVRPTLGLDTLTEVERRLAHDGGVYRFEADRYYGGAPWPLLSAMLGLAWLEFGEVGKARRLLEWAASTEDPLGRIPEQGPGPLLHPESFEEWHDRWGPPAMPLLWSSAMVLRLIIALRDVPS